MNHRPAGLLVSVRSAVEAEWALEGGAHLIDVKEPRHGSLGRPKGARVAEVVARVGGRRPVSVALGELSDPADAEPHPGPGLAFAKWGLSRLGGSPDWRPRWREACRRVAAVDPACRVVAVAYADWARAGAPSLAEVRALAHEQPGGVLLVDTFQKIPAQTLLDFLSVDEVVRLCRSCREACVRVALAGSLGAAEIEALRPAEPDWFAVRGAVCDGGRREAAVSARKVRALVELLL
jgi:(5-formylfuran-3-yl)methyl phosphate synthase